jgi:hypothetical protein
VRERERAAGEVIVDAATQIGCGIGAYQLRSLEERIENCGNLGPALRLRAVVVLAAHDWPAQRSVGRVVVERHDWVVEKARELAPAFAGVLDGLVELSVIAKTRGQTVKIAVECGDG